MKNILKIVGLISAFVLSIFGLSGCDRFIGGGQDMYGVPSIEGNPMPKNRQIEMYCGYKVKGSEVKSLISVVNAINNQDYFPKDLIIKDNSEANIKLVDNEYVYEDILDHDYYSISVEYGEEGYITAINIDDVNVSITLYETGTDIQIKTIKIDDVNDIKELSSFITELEPLSDREMVKLALLQEVNIKYNDSISIGIQLNEKGYCYYINKDENISSLAKMPQGLYEWVEEKLEDDESEILTRSIVDEKLDSLMKSSEYIEMNYDERKKVCQKLLDELVKDGEIKDYFYQDSNMMFSFEYKNGILGGIQIKEFETYFNEI